MSSRVSEAFPVNHVKGSDQLGVLTPEPPTAEATFSIANSLEEIPLSQASEVLTAAGFQPGESIGVLTTFNNGEEPVESIITLAQGGGINWITREALESIQNRQQGK